MPMNRASLAHDLPFVSVIIVHYNGKRLIKGCLDSLLKLDYPEEKREILVVDNGSRDGSVAYIRNHYPAVRILKNDVNNYARANNLGIRAAKGEFVALLNNDTKVDPYWLSELVHRIRSDECAAVAGSKILFFDGRIQSAGHEKRPRDYWADRGLGEKDCGQYDRTEEVISVSNVAVLYRKDALEKAGFFDEDFNMYSEDLDMNYRLRGFGYKVLFAPRSVVYHRLHGSQGTSALRRVLILKNRLRFLAKHFPEKLPENLFSPGEICPLSNAMFGAVLGFMDQELPRYLKGRPDLLRRLASAVEGLRDFRRQDSRTFPWGRIAKRAREFFGRRALSPPVG